MLDEGGAFVGFVDDVCGEEEFDDFPEEEDFVLGVGLLEDALAVPPQDGEEGVLEAEDEEDPQFDELQIVPRRFAGGRV